MSQSTRIPYFFSPLPSYSFHDPNNPDNNRDHWVQLFHASTDASKYYLYFLSKLSNGDSIISLPMSDEEFADKTDCSIRTARRMRTACEHAGLIERVNRKERTGHFTYQLPPSIATQAQIPAEQQVSKKPESGQLNAAKCPDNQNVDSYKCPNNHDYVSKKPESGQLTPSKQPPEATPPQAGDALPSTPLLDIKLLRFKDSIREHLIFNKEDYESVKLGDTTRNRIGDEVDDKLAAIVEGFSQYDAEEVLTIVEELVETRKWRSPVMLRTDNEANMAEIEFQLNSARDDRPKLRGGDTVRRTKDTVPENIVKEWIEDQVNEQEVKGVSRTDGKITPNLQDRTDDDKNLLRRTMLDKHEWGELDYQGIHDWHHKPEPEHTAPRKRKRATPPDDTVTNRSLTLAEIVGEENQKHQKEESKE